MKAYHSIARSEWSGPSAEAGPTLIPDREFQGFRELILRETGIFLSDAKRQLVTSRLAKRLRQLHLQSFGQYYELVTKGDDSGQELMQMINCITTNKTDFFRENHHFEFLRNRVIHEVRERAARGGARKIRIWSAACSSGEEPYTIAMTLREALDNNLYGWDVRILASDIDTQILQKAAQGVYPAERFADVPSELMQRYFLRGKGQWQGHLKARKELTDLITFRRINFVEKPWPINAKFDVIFCRNVIIYFNRDVQSQLFDEMAKFMTPDSYLFVGHSENLHWHHKLKSVGGTIYRLKESGAARDE